MSTARKRLAVFSVADPTLKLKGAAVKVGHVQPTAHNEMLVLRGRQC